MFTVVKVREGLARDDYRDPGPYKFPPGTVAYEVDGAAGRGAGSGEQPRRPRRRMKHEDVSVR